jgi:uncharacterized membrane protein YbhN (UPF0104 family)
VEDWYTTRVKRHLKTAVSLLILIATVLAFVWYMRGHQEVVDSLRQMPLLLLAAIVGLYGLWFIALAFITRATLRLYDKHMPFGENILFNAYSSLINFFGPGQSGPIFRGAYLKKRHGIGIGQYVFGLLVYYALYGVISVAMVLAGSRPWWQTVAGVAFAAAGSWAVLHWYSRRKKTQARAGMAARLTPLTIGYMAAVTAAQLLFQAIIFGLELRHVAAGVSLGQVLVYTGIANFSLFVALTPGAIGIREAFLAFSQGLHHIHGPAIAAASVIDRASFIVFLGGLFVLVISLHARDRLHLS